MRCACSTSHMLFPRLFSICFQAATHGVTASMVGGFNPRRAPALEWYAFAHDKVLEAIYTSIPVDRRAACHIQLAALLSAKHAPKVAQLKAKRRADHVALGLMRPEPQQQQPSSTQS